MRCHACDTKTHGRTDGRTGESRAVFSLSWIRNLKLKFRQDFEAKVWLGFCCWYLVDVTKLNLCQVKILKLALVKILSLKMLMFGWDFEVNAKSRFRNWSFVKNCVRTCYMNSTLGSVVPLAMFNAGWVLLVCANVILQQFSHLYNQYVWNLLLSHISLI